jgi:hypothetical protein
MMARAALHGALRRQLKKKVCLDRLLQVRLRSNMRGMGAALRDGIGEAGARSRGGW